MSVDWNAVDFAFRHAELHRTNEEGSCCCPANDILCPGCSSHKKAHVDRMAEAEQLLNRVTQYGGLLPKDLITEVRAFLKQEPVTR